MYRGALAVLALGLIALWLLTSSIRPISLQVQQRGGGGYVKLPSIGIHPVNITGLGYRPPSIRLPNATIPSVPIPILIVVIAPPKVTPPPTTVTITPRNMTTTAIANATGTGAGARPGESTTTTAARQTLVKIPTALIMAMIAVIIVVSAVTAVISARRAVLGRRESGREGEIALRQPQLAPVSRPMEAKATKVAIELGGGEVVGGFVGWGGGRLIRLEIPPDLPAIWGVGDPLGYSAAGEVILGEGVESVGGALLFKAAGCHSVGVRSGGGEEFVRVRAVDYTEDAVRLFRLNFIRDIGVDLSNLTPREIVKRLEEAGLVKDRARAMEAIRAFERAYYGRRRLGRGEYFEMLRGIRDGLVDARVIYCGQ